MTRARSVAALLLASALAGCSVHPPPSPDLSVTPRPSETPVQVAPTASPRPSPTAARTAAPQPLTTAVPAELLGPLAADFEAITRICYQFRGFGTDLDPPPLDCSTMIELALRASGDLQLSIWRAEFGYASCGSGRCPHAGTVALHSNAAGTVLLDVHRTEHGSILVGPPRRGPPPASVPGYQSPPAAAPEVPAGLEDRAPLPHCGRFFVYDDNASEPACFQRAIDAGQPAELIKDSVSLEGATLVDVYRFLGSGGVEIWSWGEPDEFGGDGKWHRRTCAVYRTIEDPNAFACI